MGKRFNVIGAILVVMVGISTARADEAADVREAAISFARALSQGSAEQAHKFAVSNKTNDTFIELVAPLAAAETRLHDAAVSRFGKDGASILTTGTPGEAFNQKYGKDPGNLDVNIAGDSAQIITKPKAGQKPEGQPLELKKVDGKWKVDLSKLQGIEAMADNAPRLKAVTKAMADTADEIKAGKYGKVQEAKMAVAEKVKVELSRPESGAKH